MGVPTVLDRGTNSGLLENNDPAVCYIAADLATALGQVETITAVRIPIPLASNYQKFEQPVSRLALIGVFVAKYTDEVRVAVTGAFENGVYLWAEAQASLPANFTVDFVTDLSVNESPFIMRLFDW